jgi:hypothetical protein
MASTAASFLASIECKKGETYTISDITTLYATANQLTVRTEGCMISLDNTIPFLCPLGETHKIDGSLKFKVTNKDAIITVEKA